MPFILVHDHDPYAVTISPGETLPAWEAYASFTRTHPWPRRALTRGTHELDPVVLQWVPDNLTTIPHKVSGTYRFRGGRPITGEIRIYDFSDQPVHGKFRAVAPGEVTTNFPLEREMTLTPGGTAILRGEFSPGRGGYLQAWYQAEFVADDGARSPLAFGLETYPLPNDFNAAPLGLTVAREPHPSYADYRLSSSAGSWIGLNGVRVEPAPGGATRFRVQEATGYPQGDPLYPPQAIAGLPGLPEEGFLVVNPDRAFDRDCSVRVDLLDKLGQRFTIWENFGRSYFAPEREVWLNLRDFHVSFWGHCSENPRFIPADVRELQLRFYCARPGMATTIALRLAVPKPPVAAATVKGDSISRAN